MRFLIAALFALTSLLLPREAAAEERILRFDSEIAVERDGTLDVTETIHVRRRGAKPELEYDPAGR